MRWIVDGMNVIGCRPDGWWKDRQQAMETLVDNLERWAADDHDVTVVFEKPPTPPIGSASVTVTHAVRAASNSADDEIVRLVHAAHSPREICVVTSDSALGIRVRAAGATVHSAAGFRNLLEDR